MNGDTVPISQIQLLESQTGKSTVENANNYFYLYYQTNRDGQKLKGEDGVVKKAMKMYFDSLIETSIVR